MARHRHITSGIAAGAHLMHIGENVVKRHGIAAKLASRIA